MTAIRLRPATETDIPALAALGRDSFIAKFGHLYCAADLAVMLAEVHSEAAVAASLTKEGQLCQLAERGGSLVGYCRLVLACGWPEHARGHRAIELKQLYTDPALTGQGIGAALMEWAMAEARSQAADEIQLSVYTDNPGAQKFYARYGFENVAEIQFRVGEQLDDEFLFALRL